MTLRMFIAQHREEIDSHIEKVLKSKDIRRNDEERRLWVLNDEGLYLWAKSEGVKI